MPKVKYICVDDDTDANLNPLLEPLIGASELLDIERVNLSSFESITDVIKQRNPDGLILDLRLDQNAINDYRAKYHGTSLAQELRTKMTEGSFPSCPIVLWSINTKLAKSFKGDDTSHDLFERVYQKDAEVINDPIRIADELVSLCLGYQKISSLSGKITAEAIYDLLHMAPEMREAVDPRIIDPLLSGRKRPAHEYAKYLLNEVIDPTGLLIDEAILAARLGVSMDSPDWMKLKAALPNSLVYEGVFNEGWHRWWAAELDSWWKDVSQGASELRSTTAIDRISILKKTFKLKKLTPPPVIEAGYSEKFWVLCAGLKQPLDPVNAVRVAAPNLKPYQDMPMLSMKAALERVGFGDGIRPHPLEQERLKNIKNGSKKT